MDHSCCFQYVTPSGLTFRSREITNDTDADTAGGYHGYWASDLYSINSRLGSADDLKSLVRTAHSKGIYIMVDVVANHMGPGDVSSFRPEPLNQGSAYHSACDINYGDQGSIEYCRIANLPDLDTENAAVKTVLNNWIKWLVAEYGFDGVRIDTVKHVSKSFWPDFAWSSGAYTIGEVWDGNPDYLAGYDGLMGGLLDYATYYPMNRFYQQRGSSQDLVDMINVVGTKFRNPAALGTFMDNHDNNRWLNQKNDYALLENCLAFVILSRGIPIVYYGTEQGYGGGQDPANREDLWRSNFNVNHSLYKAIQRLSGARSRYGGLGSATDHKHLYVADTAYAWSRAGGNLIVLTINSGGGFNGQHCFFSQRPNGSWEDIYNGGWYNSNGDGYICVQVRNGRPVVLAS